MIIVLSFTAYPGTHDQHQSGHPSQPQHITHVVVTSQPTFIVHTFRESPVRTTCPDCRSDILTSTHREIGTITWVVCLVLCFIEQVETKCSDLFNEMKNKTYHTVGTVTKSSSKIVERGKIDTNP
jgi:hypothetical protein